LERTVGSNESMSGPHDRPHLPLERLAPETLDGRRLSRLGTWAIAFLADWCPYCRSFVPDFDRLAGSGFGLAMADVTSLESPLWERFEIEVVPTVIVFREGVPIYRADGRYSEGLDSNHLAGISAAASQS